VTPHLHETFNPWDRICDPIASVQANVIFAVAAKPPQLA